MTYAHSSQTCLTSQSYAALRQGGTPPSLAQAQLGLQTRLAARLEHMFLARRDRPRFARHAVHVAAVLEAGGFPVLPDRRR